MSRKYQLSYDAINVKKDFSDSYVEARRYLLCVLGNTGYLKISSYCESTLIIEYDQMQSELFHYLKTNLAKYFHYSVCLVAISESGVGFINHSQNVHLNLRLKLELKNISCDNLKKEITNY
ncbi:hypothetical protein KHA90_11935 [Flavobacterium psychroterrae]|uniref:Homing endonuclease LAGLIDADG domain-containing protein n=1 Tax=Flavobacterium psychroterrae TaxID=2133767 RepID=A0ABS5PBP9_9FLAO|nr:hypothetical protein [Flavobacterium psychroterrae]MBS7231737.1 hypothetical protein [Flavobacterium psychroterrae]